MSPLPTSNDSMGVMSSLAEGASTDSTTAANASGKNSEVARRLGVGSRWGGPQLTKNQTVSLWLGGEGQGGRSGGKRRGVD